MAETTELTKSIGGLGHDYPLVTINNYHFNKNELKLFTLSSTNYLPTISLIIKTTSSVFRLRHNVLDGTLASVYIRSNNQTFKPIKADFLITNLSTTKSKDKEGSISTYFIDGVLHIPNFFKDTCKSYKDKTSIETLIAIAHDYGIGFVTQIDENTKKPINKMDDKMNWLCYNEPSVVFSQNVAQHSYWNKNTFYDSWIDYHYNLNFIDVNKIVSVPDDIMLRDSITEISWIQETGTFDKTQYAATKLILTNSPDAQMTTQYFNSFEQSNNANTINTIQGYERKLVSYSELETKANKEDKRIEERNHENLKTEGAEKDKITMMGRAGENYYEKQVRVNWLGMTRNIDNVHPNYHIAKIHNINNLKELDKMNIVLYMPNVNFSIYKGMMIQCLFFLDYDEYSIRVGGNVEDQGRQYGKVVDRSLSGNYYVKSVNYEWKQTYEQPHGQFSQQVVITRREWTMPNSPKFINMDNPETYSMNSPV
jgi:hypothetical protein